MEKTLQAMHRDGAQPPESVQPEEGRQLTASVGELAIAQDLEGYFAPEEWAEALHDDISLDDVRWALSTITGSLAEAVIALRQER
jgi:hypothetical protein